MSFNIKKTPQFFITLTSIVVLIFAFNLYYNEQSTHSSIATDLLKKQFQINYIDDSENSLSLSQIYKIPTGMYADESTSIHTPETLIFSVWYRINLKQSSGTLSNAFSVTVDNPTLNNITFYLLEGNDVMQIKEVGDTVYSKHDLDYVVPKMDVFDGMTHDQTLYIHIQTNGASGSPIIIESMEASQFRTSAQLMLLGCFMGIILIMVIYNFIMFKGIGDPSFFNYIGYICFAGLAIGLINGVAFYLLPFEIARWANEHLMVAHFSGLIFALRFAISFLRFDKIKPWFVNVGAGGSKLILLFAISGLFISEATLTPIYFAAVLFVYIYVISLMVMVANSRLMWVRYYLLSWLPLFLGVGIGIATFNGAVTYNFATRNAALLGVLAEICIMAIALMDRFRANEVDKDYRINHDSVTGLPNKAALESVIQKLINSNKTFTVMLFEVPEANNTIPSLGVKVANKFLIELFDNVENYASDLSSVYEFEQNLENETFHTARVGDSCFSLIFVGELSDEVLNYNFGAIQEAVSTLITVNKAAISVSCSAGVVSYPNDTLDNENILTLAFQALLDCKKSKHGWARFDQGKAENVRKRFELAAELQSAIEHDDLELFHQPQINLVTGDVYGSELLLRWEHSELGYLPPETIIKIAEETGTIHHLTEWVITQGLLQHAKLYRLGFEHTISINISHKDLSDNSLVAHILTTVAENIVPPESIVFELTESATVNDPDTARQVLTDLHKEGFKIAIDDFGTGYSSLHYLNKLPFDVLKIDKSFMNINLSKENKTIAEISIALGRRLGVSVVAEGIETPEVAKMLINLDCTLGQGYLFAKPMAFIDYMRWLQKKPIL